MKIYTACVVVITCASLICIGFAFLRRRFLNAEIVRGKIISILFLTRKYETEYSLVVAIKDVGKIFFRFTEHEFYRILSESGESEIDDLTQHECLVVMKGRRGRFMGIDKIAKGEVK